MKYKKYLSAAVVQVMLVSSLSVNTAVCSESSENTEILTVDNSDDITSESAIEFTDISVNKYNQINADSDEETIYSVPVQMVQAANPSMESMGNAGIDGNAVITVSGDKSVIDISFKAVEISGLYGHLLNMWSYPQSDSMDYSWWGDSEYEIEAETISTYNDYGLNYSVGDTTQYVFGKTFRITRDLQYENSIYIRVSIDAMLPLDQAARLDFDWENAEVIDSYNDSSDSVETVEMPVITSSNTGDNIEISISATGGAVIYYTTDGTAPTISSNVYAQPIIVTETTTINAIAVYNGISSEISSYTVTISSNSSSSNSSSDDIEDGKYWMEINLWNANIDQESMGNAAFDNNRQALVTVSGGKAVVEAATNPVYVSGYTSALKDIDSSDVDINILETESFTTNEKYDGSEHTFDYVSKFSFETDDMEEEYINVRINVPYTPMDGIDTNDGDYIDARLKLDWNGMEEAEADAQLYADNTAASGSSDSSGSSVYETDEETGIIIEADEFVFDDGVEFEVLEITDGTSYNAAEYAVGNDESEFKLYKISALLDGNEVSPSGQVSVYIPVIEGIDDENVVIYRITEGTKIEDAEKTEIEFTMDDNGDYYKIVVKELGLFAVTYIDETAEVFEVIEENQYDEIAVDTLTAVNNESKTVFEDIENHWAKEYISKAVDMGLFSGVSANKFAPNMAATRAMFVTVLGRLEGIDTADYTQSKFVDIDENDYCCPYAAWAAQMGITSGTGNNEFSPNEKITREQTAVMLYNYMQYKGITAKAKEEIPNFSDDTEVSDWANEGVNAAVTRGIICGRTDGRLDPKANTTRAELAAILVNFTELMNDN